MSKEKPLQTHDKIIAVPPREGEVPATQPPLPPQQPPQMPPQPQVQQFVPMVLQAQPVPPPPVINGKPVRLMIGIPATPLTDWRWTFQYSQMRVQYPTAMIAADNKYGIAQSREAILNQFNAVPDATHLLFVDTDIMPPDYAVYTLLADMANPDVEIVSGIYYNSLFTGLAAWIDEHPLCLPNNIVPNAIPITNLTNNNTNPLIKVDKFGFGFTLITKELMKKLLVVDRPLMYYKISDGALHSEDFYFAAILKRLGVNMYVDVRVQCGHIKNMMIHCNGQATM